MTRTRLLTSLSIACAVLIAVLVFNRFDTANQDDGLPGYAISGRVVMKEGSVPAGLRVRVRWLEDAQVRSVTVPVQGDGAFTADRLAPGYYTLLAIPSGESAQPLGSLDVTISDSDLTGLVMNLTQRQ